MSTRPLNVFVAARRVASWVGPGTPHPSALEALSAALRTHAPGVEDHVVAHAGSFAAALVLNDDRPSAADLEIACAAAFRDADAETARAGLAPPGGAPAFFGLPLSTTDKPQRLALCLAFGAGRVEGAVREAAGVAARDAASGGAAADAALVLRLRGDDAVDRLVAAWRKSGHPLTRVAAAAHPGAWPRVVGLGFEVGPRTLLGPVDLFEDAPAGP